MMFIRCSTETLTLPLFLLKLLSKFYVSATLKYFCTFDCRTKIVIKLQLLNCSWESTLGHLASKCSVTRAICYSTRFTAYKIIHFGLNCCMCYKAARMQVPVAVSHAPTPSVSWLPPFVCTLFTQVHI